MVMLMKITLDEYGLMPQQQNGSILLLSPKVIWAEPLQSTIIETGIHVRIPSGYLGDIQATRGLRNVGIMIYGMIDEWYRDEIRILVFNSSRSRKIFNRGDPIALMKIIPCTSVSLEQA